MERGAFKLCCAVGLGLSLSLALPGCGGGTANGLTGGPAASSDASDLFASLTRVVIPQGSKLFLKLAGIEGESTAEGHKGEIHIESFSWGVSQTGTFNTGSGASAARPVFDSFSINKQIDKASPLLFDAAVKGKHISEGVLAVERAGDKSEPFYQIRIEDILIGLLTQNVDPSSEDIVNESMSFNFSKITIRYTPQKADGSPGEPVEASYDLKTGRYY